MMRVSIATVVLNARDGLLKTLDSVRQNRCEGLEYIVVDGGSTDGTLDVIHANEQDIDRWISEGDRGVSHAFNKALGMTTGDIIGILNAGDWYNPDTIACVLEAFDRHPDVDVVCGAVEFWEHGKALLHCRSNPEALDRETSVYHPTVFVRKKSYSTYGVFDETYRYAMDYELLLRLNRQGAKFMALESTLANMDLEGLSYTNWYKALKEVRNARSKYFPLYNTCYYHFLAIVKNITARALKIVGLRSVYQSYWQSKNQRITAIPGR